jgi:pimeloyl-ACP methyl ester carboxylesterase
MSAIILGDDIIHYEVLGRGRPILFLHGWVGSWRYWIPVMQMASASYRAYALDLYGYGDTVKNRQRYSLESQAGLVEGFIDKLGIGRIAIVGHGLGAFVGLLYALRNPGVVDRVLAISFPLDEGLVTNRLRSTHPVDLAVSMLGRTPQAEPVLTDVGKTDPQAVIGSLADWGKHYGQGLWGQLNTPCLLVYGNNDSVVQLPRQEQSHNLAQQAHIIVFDGAGHFPMLDDSSKFCRLLGDFLSLEPGESPQKLQLKAEWKRRIR